MKLYIKSTDFDREEINPNLDLILRSNVDQILDIYFLDEWEDSIQISGYIVYFVVKNKPTDEDDDALINLAFNDSTFPNPQAGEAAITLLADVTKDLLGNYVYQILLGKGQSGVPLKVVAEGTICFQKNILIDRQSGSTGPAPYQSESTNL